MNKPMLFSLVFCVGCGEYQEETPKPPKVVHPDEPHFLMVFALDMSSPFRERFLKETGTWKFVMETAANLQRDRVGENDEIVISQLSTERHSVLWQGSLRDLRRRFASPDDFKQFLINNSKTAAAPSQGLANTIKYLTQLPGVSERRTSVYIAAISSFEDCTGIPELTLALKDLRRVGGTVEYYWVDTDAIETLQAAMMEAGYNKPHFKPIPADRVPGLRYEEQ